jgi:hypothetical protein
MGKHPLNRTKEVSVNVVPSVDANNVDFIYRKEKLLVSDGQL